MPPRDNMDPSADPSDENYLKTANLDSEVSTAQHTASEGPEDHEIHEKGNFTADPSDRNPPAKNKNQKASYAERENRTLAAQVSHLKSENAKLDALKTNSENDLVFLHGRFDKLDSELSQLKRERKSWLRERKVFDANISRIENENINIRSKNDSLEDQKEKVLLESRMSDRERVNMRKLIRKLKDEKVTLEEHIIGLDLSQTELRNTISSLQQEKRILNTQLGILQNEQQASRAEKTFLQNKLAEFNSAKTRWADTNECLAQMVKDLESENFQKEEEILRLIDQGSGLAEEISGLRLQHLVDDDSALKEKFHFLHFAIRSWCVAIHDAKAPKPSAIFSGFPLAVPGSPVRLCDVPGQEVNILIACTWEWMVKLIFGSANIVTGYNDSPDLWIDEDKALYLHNLELHLQTRDPKAAMEWRSLTVQHLAVEGPSLQDARIGNVVAKILRWTSQCLHLDISAESMVQIRQNLKNEVVARAIEFSLDLRRQHSVVWPHVPQNLDTLMACQLGMRKHDISRTHTEVKICIRPQLRRLSLASTKTQLSYDNIVEAELGVLELPPTFL